MGAEEDPIDKDRERFPLRNGPTALDPAVKEELPLRGQSFLRPHRRVENIIIIRKFVEVVQKQNRARQMIPLLGGK